MIHLRTTEQWRLHVARSSVHAVGVEPLAKLLRGAMDAAGLEQADVATKTGLDRRHISQILNRKQNYSRPPTIHTLQALAQLPGLSMEDVAAAVAESTGMPISTIDYAADMTPLRRSVHAVVDKLPEDELNRALQILVTLLG